MWLWGVVRSLRGRCLDTLSSYVVWLDQWASSKLQFTVLKSWRSSRPFNKEKCVFHLCENENLKPFPDTNERFYLIKAQDGPTQPERVCPPFSGLPWRQVTSICSIWYVIDSLKNASSAFLKKGFRDATQKRRRAQKTDAADARFSLETPGKRCWSSEETCSTAETLSQALCAVKGNKSGNSLPPLKIKVWWRKFPMETKPLSSDQR